MATDPSKYRIKDVVGNLTVGQLWAVGAAAFTLVAGSFTLGYQASTSLQEKSARSTASLEEEVSALSEKNRFLGLNLRYELAKNELEREDADAAIREQYETARDALDSFVRERVDSQDLILNKGSGRLATIRFKDGTVWEIPQELHAAAAAR